MGQPVVDFEVVGKDGEKLRRANIEIALFTGPEGQVIGLVK
jgi:hypothetical protein